MDPNQFEQFVVDLLVAKGYGGSVVDIFANHEYAKYMGLHLKPQDVVVLLKFVAIGDRSWTYAGLAGELGMSASEVHGATKRLAIAQLFFPDSGTVFHGNAVEFLVSGVRYAFPAEWGTQTVGLPTAYAAPPLNSQIVPGNALPPVWPSRNGTVAGIALTPLYPSVPEAVHADPHLYELLALVDALRTGKARERMLAGQIIKDRVYSAARREVA